MRKGRDGKTEIGLWVADNRNRLGMSVPDLEAETGYSRSSIAKVEGGSNKEPSKAIIGAIFRALRKRAAEIGDVVPEPPGYGETGPSAMGEAGVLAAVIRDALAEQTKVLERAIEARTEVVVSLLEELKLYREQAAQAQRVELDLIEALPQALATALALERASKPAADPEPGPREPAAIPQS